MTDQTPPMTDEQAVTTGDRGFSGDDILFDGGLSEADRPLVAATLKQIITRLERGSQGAQLSASVKDRDSADPRTTLELTLPGQPRLVATSALLELKDALNDAEARLLAQLNERLGRREARNNRDLRGRPQHH